MVQTGELDILMVADQQQYAYIVLDHKRVMKIDVVDYKVAGEATLPLYSPQELEDSSQIESRVTQV